MDLLALPADVAAVHRMLLRLPGTPVLELCHHTGLDEAAVTAALEVLRERRLVRGLVPVRPDTVLEPDLLDVEQDLARRRNHLQEARREVAELVELYVGGVARSERTLEVERIDSGQEAVQRRLDELVAGVSEEVLAIAPSYSPPEAMVEELEHSAAMAARGVSLRTVVTAAALEDPARRRHSRDMAAVGEQLRVHPDPPVRMLLLDRRVAVVPIDPAQAGLGALVVWSTTVVRSLALLYEFVWSQSTEPLQAKDTGPGGPGPRGARLLELLAAGLTDEAVARHLDVSVRTVRRESAALLDSLGTSSRFQAGVEAARRGWL